MKAVSVIRISGLIAVGVVAVGSAGFLVGSLRPPPTVMVVPGHPNSAVVDRFDSYAAVISGAPNSEAVVSDSSELSRLIHDLNGMPPYPRGARSCSGNIVYRVRFTYPNSDKWTVQLDVGCSEVQVAGDAAPIASAYGSPVFRDLDQLLNEPSGAH